MKKKKNKKHDLSEETKEKILIHKKQLPIETMDKKTKKKIEKKQKKAEKKAIKIQKKMEKKAKEVKIPLPKAFETMFSMVYLGFLVIATYEFFSLSGRSPIYLMYGCLTAILLFGDSFHLIPRIIRNLNGKLNMEEYWFGLGNQISSITMTGYYLILFFIYEQLFPEIEIAKGITIAIWTTVILRVLICLLPQNNWYEKKGNIVFSILRNMIFLITGILEIILFAKAGNTNQYALWQMTIAIGLSFLFYLPVAFWAKKHPKLGMLMLLKTGCYIWMIGLGLNLIGRF